MIEHRIHVFLFALTMLLESDFFLTARGRSFLRGSEQLLDPTFAQTSVGSMKHHLTHFFPVRTQEHIDYDLVESTNPQFGKAIVRVNIFRNHRQTIQ